jgi:hypothetical protein
MSNISKKEVVEFMKISIDFKDWMWRREFVQDILFNGELPEYWEEAIIDSGLEAKKMAEFSGIKRTYAEAVKICVEWWVNHLNGNPTKEQKSVFSKKLTELLEEGKKNILRRSLSLKYNYHMLVASCLEAKLNPSCLPQKGVTTIWRSNEVSHLAKDGINLIII